MANSLRDKVFYVDSEIKWKALMHVLYERGESIGPQTMKDYDGGFPYHGYHPHQRFWGATRRNLSHKETIKL